MAPETSPIERPTVQGPRARPAAGDPSTAGDATWDSGRRHDESFRGGTVPRWLGRDGSGDATTFLGTAHGPRVLECLRE